MINPIERITRTAPKPGDWNHAPLSVLQRPHGRILPMPTERKGFWQRVMGR